MVIPEERLYTSGEFELTLEEAEMKGYWDGISRARATRRRVLAAAGSAAAGAALLSACGGGNEQGLKFDNAGDSRKPGTVWFSSNDWKLADETKAAVRGGIYRSVMTGDHASHYDPIPIAGSQVPSSDHLHQMLMARNRGPGIDPKSPEASNPEPALAQSWEISNDGATVTFKLRPNVKWHPVAPVNGRTMDIDDWRTTHDRYVATGEQRQSFIDVVDHAEFPDAKTMVWKLRFPYASIYDRVYHDKFAYMVLPKELNANTRLAETTAIGTGYKILDKHQPSIGMEYRKHADYWGGDPFIERWHFPIIPEYANRYAQFVSGNIIDFEPTARDVLKLAKDAPQAVIVADPIPDDRARNLRFGRENQKTLPWKDPRVRIAIRRSINFQGIGEFLSNKQQFEAAGIPIELLPTTHMSKDPSFWLNPEKGELGALSANYLFDVAEAKKLMAAAGYTSAGRHPILVLPVQGVTPEQEQLVIDSLAAAGTFKVEIIRSVNTVAHRNCRSLGQCDGSLVRSGATTTPDYIIYRDYHSKGNTEGEQAYPDPRIDRVAEAQRRELDVEKRIEYIKEFQMLAAELMPLIPFVHQYTKFRFRWPWVHNNNYGSVASRASRPGRPQAVARRGDAEP